MYRNSLFHTAITILLFCLSYIEFPELKMSSPPPPPDNSAPAVNFLQEDNCYVALTHDPLDVRSIMDRVKSPKAGATVVFSGTTRDNFDGKPVADLQYTAYAPRALRTMLAIGREVSRKHGLTGLALAHRLGTVGIGEESILLAVSSPHRRAAWRAGEEALEEVKARAEVWKREHFAGDGAGGGAEDGGGVWRANRDGVAGERAGDVEKEEKEEEQKRKSAEGDGEGKKQKTDGEEDGELGQEHGGIGGPPPKPRPLWLNGRPKAPVERGHGPVVHPKRTKPVEPRAEPTI